MTQVAVWIVPVHLPWSRFERDGEVLQAFAGAGIAEATAWAMIIEMPELGTLDGKQAASLAGLAPISRQSGKWQGKERIQGGPAFLRRAI